MGNLIKNRKASYNYHIFDKIEAGISLTGQEAKALRSGKGSLSGAFISLKNNQAYLLNLTISPYQPNNISKDYNPQRERKLLLKKSEIKNLIGKVKEKGVTLIPLSIYTRKNFIKVEVGVVKGKKKYDKRESIKKREIDRDIRRRLK